jgi:hypothetical protein
MNTEKNLYHSKINTATRPEDHKGKKHELTKSEDKLMKNTLKKDEEIRIGTRKLVCGGITLEAEPLMISNAIQINISSCVEPDDKGEGYHVDTSRAVKSLRMSYPSKTRVSTEEDIPSTKTLYQAVCDEIMQRKSERVSFFKNCLVSVEDLMLADMEDALLDAAEFYEEKADRYASFVNAAGVNFIGLMEYESIISMLNLYFEKAYPLLTA